MFACREILRAVSPENTTALRGVRYGVSLPRGRASQRRTLDERLCVPPPGGESRVPSTWPTSLSPSQVTEPERLTC
jgi:hypothetical protein